MKKVDGTVKGIIQKLKQHFEYVTGLGINAYLSETVMMKV